MDNDVRNFALATLHSCPKCPSQFKGPSGLFQHNRTVHMGLTFPCEQCAKVLNTKTNLKIHIRTKHDNQWHACNQCEFKGTFKPELLRHVRVKHEEIKLECDLCERNYSNIKNLRLHKTSVHDCIRHYCEQCDQSFVLKDTLNKHKRTKHSSTEDLAFTKAQKKRRKITDLDTTSTLETTTDNLTPETGEIGHLRPQGNSDNFQTTSKSSQRKPTDKLNDLDLIPKELSDIGNQTTKPENEPEQSGETLRDTVKNLKTKSNGEMLDNDWEMFECDKCNKKYNHRSGLFNHTKAVHEGVKFQCNHCNYTSHQKYKVKMHGQRLHVNQA